MRNHNSLSPVEVYEAIFIASLSDVASSSSYPKREYARDLNCFRDRMRREGIGLLTVTFPSIAKAVDLALATGTRLQIPGLRKARGQQLPVFLGWLFSQVFDVNGMERSDASPWVLSALRQLLGCFYKLELPPTEKQVRDTVDKFVLTDQSLAFDADNLDNPTRWIRDKARAIIARVLNTVDPYDGLKPRNGPGAVATRERGAEKVVFGRYYPQLAGKFPYEDHFYYNLNHLCDDLDLFLAMPESEVGIARVVLVPKDSRGPRLISCEPLAFQWVQQGLMSKIVELLESHPITGGQVNFSNQEINRDLAMRGSRGEPWVTLDMKDASDRVSLSLVRDLFPNRWFEALQASRSAFTELPCGRILGLKKFAPMGSAVCFPVEALIFWALSVATCMYAAPDLSLKNAASQVFVYGDDIICQSKDQSLIRQYLPKFELKFNEGKCCTAGSFRESCGCDAFKGVDVTPLRVKCVWDRHLAGVDYDSWVKYANAFYRRGMFMTGDFIAGLIQQVRRTPYSDVECPSFVALVDVRKTASQENRLLGIRSRLNKRYQYREIDAWQVRSRVVEDTRATGWDELQRIAAQMGWSTPSAVCSGSSHGDRRIKPAELNLVSAAKWAGEISVSVRAYQYTLPRQSSLRRGWCRVE